MDQPNLIAARFEILSDCQSAGSHELLRVKDARALTAPSEALLLQATAQSAPGGGELDLEVLSSLELSCLPPLLEHQRSEGPDLGYNFLLFADAVGPDLEAWAAERPAREWLDVLILLAEGLAELHSNRWLHLRLGSTRIVLTARGPVWLDPGCLATELSVIGRGAPRVDEAPELSVGGPIDRRADLYGFGRRLKTLLDTAGDPGDAISRALRDLSELLLAEHPAARPRDAIAVRDQLAGISGAPRATGDPRPLSVLAPAFAYRERELTLIRDTAERALGLGEPPRRSPTTRLFGSSPSEASSLSAVMLIEGEDGVGKRRLAGHLVSQWRHRGADVIALSAAEARASSVDPVASLLRHLLTRAGAILRASSATESVRRELLRLLPELLARVPAPPSQSARDQEVEDLSQALGERARLLDNLASFLIDEARARPYVLFLSEVDELPALAAELVAHLARRISTTRRWQRRFTSHETALDDDASIPLFVLATTAQPRGQHPLSDLGDALHSIELEPLAPPDLGQLLSSALGVAEVSPELLSFVGEAGRALPGPCLVALRELNSHGALVRARESARLDEATLDQLGWSQRPHKTLSSRLDALDEAALSLLCLPLLRRRPLSPGFMITATAIPAHDGPVTLALLLRLGLLRRDPNGLVSCAPAVRLEALRSRLPAPIIEQLEQRLLSALAAVYQERGGEARLIELTDTALRHGDRELFTRLAPEAAACLERVRADARATEVYRALLELNPGLVGETPLSWRLRLSTCSFRAGGFDEARTQLERVLRDASPIWPEVPRAMLWRRLGTMHAMAEQPKEAIEAFAQGELLLEDCTDPESPGVKAQLLASRAELLLRHGRRKDEVKRLCERAQDLLRVRGVARTGHELALLRARLLALQGQLETLRERHGAAEQLTLGALALQERHGATLSCAHSYQRLGHIALGLNEQADAERYWRRALDMRQQLGDRRGLADVLALLGRCATRFGDLEDGRRSILKSLRMREESGDLKGRAASLQALGDLDASAGRLEDAVAAYTESLALSESCGDQELCATALTELGAALAQLGETHEALDRQRGALKHLRGLGDRAGEATCLARLAIVQLHRGRFDRALSQAERARRLRDDLGGADEVIDSLLLGARIDEALGRNIAAAQQALQAVELARKEKRGLQSGPALLLRGRLLVRLGQLDQAEDALTRAAASFKALNDRRGQHRAQIERGFLALERGARPESPAHFGSREEPSKLGRGPAALRGFELEVRLALLSGDLEEGERHAQAALTLAHRSRLKAHLWRCLRWLSACAEQRGDDERRLSFAVQAQSGAEALLTHIPPELREACLANSELGPAIRGSSALEELRLDRSGPAAKPSTEGEGKSPGVTISPARGTPTTPRPRGTTVHVQALRRLPPTPSSPLEATPSPEATPAPELTASAARSAAELAAMGRLNHRLLREGPSEPLYRSLLFTILKLTDAERGLIGVVGPDGRLQLRAVRGLQSHSRTQARELFALTTAAMCAREHRRIASDDAASDPALREHSSLLGLGLRSVLALPIQARQRRAVLYLDHRFQRAAFSRRRERLASAFADLAGLMLSLEQGLSSIDRRARMRAARSELAQLAGSSACSVRLRAEFERLRNERSALVIVAPRGCETALLARALLRARDVGAGPIETLETNSSTEPVALADALARARGGGLVIRDLQTASASLLESLAAHAAATSRDSPRIIGLWQSPEHPAPEAMLGALRAERLELPALAERADGVPMLAATMLDQLASALDVSSVSLNEPAKAWLSQRPWPGNDRELRALLRSCLQAAPDRAEISVELLEEASAQATGATSPAPLSSLAQGGFDAQRDALEARLVAEALAASPDRRSAAAALGISVSRLRRLERRARARDQGASDPRADP